MDIIYKIEFFSDWHCGSGLSSGADVDLIVVKDKFELPFIPGKTIKGLLKDAALSLQDFNAVDDSFIEKVFGKEAKQSKKDQEHEHSKECVTFFSNAELTDAVKKQLKDKTDLIYRSIASTAIEENGQAKEHSLRKMEVVVPLTLFGKIANVPDEHKESLKKCMQFTKRMGTGRTRGLGRCQISIAEEVK